MWFSGQVALSFCCHRSPIWLMPLPHTLGRMAGFASRKVFYSKEKLKTCQRNCNKTLTNSREQFQFTLSASFLMTMMMELWVAQMTDIKTASGCDGFVFHVSCAADGLLARIPIHAYSSAIRFGSGVLWVRLVNLLADACLLAGWWSILCSWWEKFL